MKTRAIEGELADARRRIGRMRASAQGGLGAQPWIGRHLDALQAEEARVRAAARQAPDEVEQWLGQLSTRLDIAERSLAADLSDDWATFAAAVEAELRGWDTYLERLQTTVAARAWRAREHAEAAIGEVRTRRIAVDERLSQAHDGADEAWRARRNRVAAARDALEQKANEFTMQLS